MKRLGIVAAVVLVAGAAWAVPLNLFRTVAQFLGGINVGEAAYATSGNKVTRVLAADIDWNFASSTIVCTDSRDVSMPGALVGDPCAVGVLGDHAANSSFHCMVVDGGVAKLRHCAHGTAADPGDAGFKLRVISAN